MPADEKDADPAGKRGAGTVREAGVAQEESEGAAGAARTDAAADDTRRTGAGAAAGVRGDGAGDGAAGVREDDGADADDLTVRDAVSAPDALGRPRRVTRRFPL
ncbi:hypothetical protein NGM37_30280, partial [Streptomyces sp. TRM76130]|nr:hypothetical protein [Streptomyces sp. TRM76130]